MDIVSLESVAGNSFNDGTFFETELKTGFNLQFACFSDQKMKR